MHYLYLISVWIHILAAIVWIGGAAFLVLILMPALRRPEYKAISAPLLHWSALRFRKIGWTCLVTLVTTGVFNLSFRGFSWASLFDGSLFQGPFGRILSVKLTIVAFILFISLLHDFFLGPRAAAAILKDPGSPEAMRGRVIASWMGRTTVFAALAATAAGVALVRGWPG